ncbi:catalase [Xylariomycetidae sp. FL0641]|nr:catalase [Xylariomycetidae sp. FL0641]
MDDWQETAFTSRHVHNRVGKPTGRAKRHRAFDVKKTFGSYALNRGTRAGVSAADGHSGRLELYRLSASGDGVMGELFLAGSLAASLVLAGSRQALRDVAEEEDMESEPAQRDDAAAADQDEEGVGRHEAAEGSGNGTDDDDDDTRAQRRRYQAFEKNSFWAPKFWLRWRGQVTTATTTAAAGASTTTAAATGPGYLVFAGNDCARFQGTLSCEALGWDNVSISGRKTAARHERDVPVAWSTAQ